ncbi:inactive dipeptidyl peptidase 10-like protein [Sarcoptes scabiei]|uniref:Venom dipeptidyl peptidase 4 n=1 Tax=Sarcoptes scabiei TaxID=52283 RepID=A0A132ADA2_SARSC|nr:inactive dipeptidyl peptidase 10-like protein [Sarcoptes scabiei]
MQCILHEHITEKEIFIGHHFDIVGFDFLFHLNLDHRYFDLIISIINILIILIIECSKRGRESIFQRFVFKLIHDTEILFYDIEYNLKVYDVHLLHSRTLIKFTEVLAEWGPKKSQLAFVYHNNLYYKHSARSETIRLSVTGSTDSIFNGINDWLYEEEIFSQSRAIWFSPNGDRLAYLQINDSLVDIVHWNHYDEYHNVSTNQYPNQAIVRYPKPGRQIPQVSVFVVDCHSEAEQIRMVRIDPPKKLLPDKDFYITKVLWFDDQRFLIAWTLRNQRLSLLTVCELKNLWKCDELYDLTSSTGWVDGFENGLMAASNLNRVIIRIPRFIDKNKGEFFHLATINLKIMAFFFELSSLSFYSSTLTNHPEVEHIMKTDLNAQNDPICLTCYLGNSCRSNEAKFNPSGTYYILECKGYEIPRIELRSSQTNDLIEIWEENSRLVRFLQTKLIPRYEKIFVKLSENHNAIVELILPHDFEENHQYPMIIELYGAPGTQMIKDRYDMNNWSSFLTSKHRYIYAKIDCRGSSNQGIRHLHQLYKRIGKIEVDDLITVVWFLKNNITYVDPERIAIWGWSYGGYFSLMSLIKQNEHRLFACAIAVAPVSNWMFYDAFYAERYLGVPKGSQNLRPYQESNLLDLTERLRNKKFLLIFGTGDDNVHDQHSLLLIRQLNQQNIDYNVQIYPDDNHYLSRSSQHLYPKMTDFLQNNCFRS